MAWKWLGRLEEEYPELAKRAKAMNKRDNYVMKYDPVEIERRERAERRRKQLRKQQKQVRWERLHRDSLRPAATTDQENCLKRSRMESRATVSP